MDPHAHPSRQFPWSSRPDRAEPPLPALPRQGASKHRATAKPCRKFLQGKCTWGDNCRWSHLLPDLDYPRYHSSDPFTSLGTETYAFPTPPPGKTSFALDAETNTRSPVGLPQETSSTIEPAPAEPLPPQSGYGAAASSHICNRSVNPSDGLALAWKTAPCRHFMRYKGYCPAGDTCNYIHDLSLAPPPRSSLIGKSATRAVGIDKEVPSSSSSRVLSGGVLIGPRPAHCWAYVQGTCRMRDCRYSHPQDVRPYQKYTPCPAWSTCLGSGSCPFRHIDQGTTRTAAAGRQSTLSPEPAQRIATESVPRRENLVRPQPVVEPPTFHMDAGFRENFVAPAPFCPAPPTQYPIYEAPPPPLPPQWGPPMVTRGRVNSAHQVHHGTTYFAPTPTVYPPQRESVVYATAPPMQPYVPLNVYGGYPQHYPPPFGFYGQSVPVQYVYAPPPIITFDPWATSPVLVDRRPPSYPPPFVAAEPDHSDDYMGEHHRGSSEIHPPPGPTSYWPSSFHSRDNVLIPSDQDPRSSLTSLTRSAVQAPIVSPVKVTVESEAPRVQPTRVTSSGGGSLDEAGMRRDELLKISEGMNTVLSRRSWSSFSTIHEHEKRH